MFVAIVTACRRPRRIKKGRRFFGQP